MANNSVAMGLGASLTMGIGAHGAEALFAGPGEMRALCRAHDWSATPLGPVAAWSQSLRSMTRTLLASRQPMVLAWGPDLIQIYNDAYRPSFGESDGHPRGLGSRGVDFWAATWDEVGPQIAGVMTRGDATWHENQLVPIERNGQIEDAYFTFGFSPVYDDDGSIGGALSTVTETTRSIAAAAAQERPVASERQAREDAEAPRAAADARVADITARAVEARERERLLRELDVERTRLAYVFDQAPTFLAVLRGPSYEFTLANAAFGQLVGRRDLIGRTVMDVFPEMLAQGFIALMDDVLTTGTPFVGREMPVSFAGLPDSNADHRFIDFVYMPLIEADGTRSGIISHGSDVTASVLARQEIERLLETSEKARLDAEAARLAAEESERRFRDNANGAPVLIWTSGVDAECDWFNTPWLAFTGRTMEEETGNGWVERVHPDDYARCMEVYLTHFAARQPFGMEYRLLRHDGEYRWLLDNGVPRFSEGGAFRGYIGTCFDSTEGKRAREAADNALVEAIEARAEAERANKAKSEFLAIMSHELRTPLNAIDGYAELMELGIRGPITDEQRQDLGRIRQSEKHLLGLINGVLNYAQIEAGAVHYEFEDVPVDEMLATCEALTAPQVRINGLCFLREPCDPVMRICADRDKTQQIVLNLLSNAIKFTASGGEVRVVGTVEKDGQRWWVRIDVQDTGPGIADDQLSRLFQPFAQVDTSLTRTRDGTGLGLAISRDLARGMGGDLTAASTPGVGSTFTLTLPAAA